MYVINDIDIVNNYWLTDLDRSVYVMLVSVFWNLLYVLYVTAHIRWVTPLSPAACMGIA